MLAIEHLEKIPLFKDLKPEQLAALANNAKPEHFHASQEIVRQGDLCKRFVIVDAGFVNLWQTDAEGFEKSLGVVTPLPPPGSNAPHKNYFGEQTFTSQEPYEFHATAITDVEAFIIERGDFDALTLTQSHILDALPFIKEAEKARTHGFGWIGEGEAVAAVIHKHWWVLLPGLVPILIGAVGVLVLKLVIDFIALTMLSVVFPVSVALLLMWLVFTLYDWRNDAYIVTNQRVAHVERIFVTKGLRESVPIDKILGVTVEREGPAGLLGVSTLIIQSAGREEGNVTFSAIANANQIRRIILTQQERVRARQIAEERERQRAEIQRTLREYILPQVVAEEQAKTQAPTLPSALLLPFRQRLARTIGSWLDLEIRQTSSTMWRKHWTVLLRQTRNWLLGLVVLTGVFVFLALNPGLQVLPSGGYILGGLMALVICLGGLWWEWEDWRNDTYAVTDTQIVDAERLPLGLREKSTTAPLDQVQDIKIEVPNIWATMLNYGDLKIETAGKGGQMVFHSIRNPKGASEEIFRRLEAYRKRRAEREAAIRNRGVVDALVGYDRLRREEERWQRQRQADSTQSSMSGVASQPGTDVTSSASSEGTMINPPQSDSESGAGESDTESVA